MSHLTNWSAVRARLTTVTSPATLPLLDGDNVKAHASAHPAGFRTWRVVGGSSRVGGRSVSGMSLVGPATVEVRAYVPIGVGPGGAVAELDAIEAAFHNVRVGDFIFGDLSGPYLGRDSDPECPEGWFCAGINLNPESIRTVATAA